MLILKLLIIDHVRSRRLSYVSLFVVITVMQGVAGCNHAAKSPIGWNWSNAKANLTNSIEQHLPDYQARVVGSGLDRSLQFAKKDSGEVIATLKLGDSETVFTRVNNVIYLAVFNPQVTGCKVIAVDLKTGSELWKTKLVGLGPIDHSKYLNSVNIETDGKQITVFGNETAGRYIEVLDAKTGETLSNTTFDADPESLLR